MVVMVRDVLLLVVVRGSQRDQSNSGSAGLHAHGSS